MTCSKGLPAEGDLRERSLPGARDEVRALSIGPAASLGLSADGMALCVQSIFPSTLNLEVAATGWLVALGGPTSQVYPHSVALEWPVDFRAWNLAVGDPAGLLDGSIWIQGQAGRVVVDLSQAQRPAVRGLPTILRLRGAHRACVARLWEIQTAAGYDLSIDALWREEQATTALGAGLRSAALALGVAVQVFARTPGVGFAAEGGSGRGGGEPSALLSQAVTALVGLGGGLTPSGDDFLCGFMAAVRACDPGLVEDRDELINGLNEEAERNLQRTTQISAFLIRCAAQNFWPLPVMDLAEALAGDFEPAALKALEELCGLGHSSGSDLATGFLFGLECLAMES